MTLLMGAVAYDAKVVTIWSGFRAWLRRHGLPFDFVLYSHYERQVEDLIAGRSTPPGTPRWPGCGRGGWAKPAVSRCARW